MSTFVIVFLTGLFFSGFFSMLEAAVISQDRHRLWHRADSGDRNAIIMRDLLSTRAERLLAAVLLCNNLANVSCAASATALASEMFEPNDVVLFSVTLAVTFVLLVFGEITPKVVGVHHAGRIAAACARPLLVLLHVLSPFIRVAEFLSSCLLLFLRLRRRPSLHAAMNTEELRAAIRAAGRAAGDGGNLRYAMLENTLLFDETPVEKIMTPRRDIVGINLSAGGDAIARQLTAANFSKLPLLEDGGIDKAKGVVDTLQALRRARGGRLSAEDLKTMAEKVYYAPAAASALRQLQEMRREKRRLAFVLDGAGRVVGLLTFANFAAAILGGETLPEVKRRADGALEVPPTLPLLQLAQLEPRLPPPPDTSATTINGLILEHLGDAPDAPMCPLIGDWRMEISGLEALSVRRVFFYPPAQDAEAERTDET